MRHTFKCCICGNTFINQWGNNPWPVVDKEGAECCDQCNALSVIPARMGLVFGKKEAKNDN